MAKGISAPAVFAAGAGGLIIWAGLKGTSVVGGLKTLLSGKQPVSTNTHPLSQPGSSVAGSFGGIGATGSAIADAGLRYVGSGSVYKWGGGNPNGWDCSGFANYVIGHDLGSPIPGLRSGFNGSSHGPVTGQWALFGNPIPRSEVQAGDLVIWPAFHMGIAVSNSQMVNCPGPNGTPNPIVSSIDGGGTGVMVARRIGVQQSIAFRGI